MSQFFMERSRKRRRTGGGTESEQAALRERPLLRIIEFAAARRRPHILALARVRRRQRPCSRLPLTRGGIERWHTAVRRIDDDGCSNLPVDHRVCRALFQPEPIVAPDGAAPCLPQTFETR